LEKFAKSAEKWYDTYLNRPHSVKNFTLVMIDGGIDHCNLVRLQVVHFSDDC
jgi:hypothetical protein